jgi:AcrR family transcriptional regulator
MTANGSGGQALRVDAARNRAAIITAATRVYADRGLSVPVEEVADAAGVGIATLYRRFPNRCQLIAAAYDNQVRALATELDSALRDPDPGDGFARPVMTVCAAVADDAGLADVLTFTCPHHPVFDRQRDSAARRVAALVARAQRHGGLRPDFQPHDLTALISAAAAVAALTHHHDHQPWKRFLAYQLETLQTPALATRLPAPGPVTWAVPRVVPGHGHGRTGRSGLSRRDG